MPFISADDLASDPALATHYVFKRNHDAVQLQREMSFRVHCTNCLRAEIYGYSVLVHTRDHWVELVRVDRAKVDDPVRMETLEQAVAYLLAKCW